MKRAIGIVRVSETAGREGDRFHSPFVQRMRISSACQEWDLVLDSVMEELDVSGGKPLAQRPALSQALAEVEAGRAEAIVFAYRDRMDRSIETGSELIRRMDAKGALLIADGQRITHATHDGWRRATFESFLNEDQRRAVGAKMRGVHERCIREGIAPFIIPPGYRRREDGRAELDPKGSSAMYGAWQMRAAGRSIPYIQRYLANLGTPIKVSVAGLVRIFESRFYLGELHYGGYEPNLTAHEPLITPELFAAVQVRKGTLRGRPAKSDHLLARQGILVCAGCGGRMTVSCKTGGKNPFYRCPTIGCEARAAISAPLVEGLVVERTRELARGLVGRANGESRVREAKAALDTAQAAYEGAVAAFSGLEGPEAAERLRELWVAREVAQGAHLAALARDEATTLSVNADVVLDHGSLEGKRELIRAVIERVTVAKGKGPDRVAIRGKVA